MKWTRCPEKLNIAILSGVPIPLQISAWKILLCASKDDFFVCIKHHEHLQYLVRPERADSKELKSNDVHRDS